MPALGGRTDTAAPWTMNPVVDEFAEVIYQKYFIAIQATGNFRIARPVTTKITWTLSTGGGTDQFIWGPGPDAGSTQNVTVPAGGGTLGDGGSIVDSGGAQWPTVVVDLEFTGTAGTVVFERVGGAYSNLKKLTLNVVVTAEELG